MKLLNNKKLLYLILAAIFIWAIWDTECDITSLIKGIPSSKDFIFRFFPPDFNILPGLLIKIKETFQIALLGMGLSVFFSIPLALLSSGNIVCNRYIYHFSRFILDSFRGISEIIWALLFVSMVGLGSFAGILALAIHNTGALGKYLSETIENINSKTIEAVIATGANRFQVIRFGILKIIKPYIANYILYYFEHNIRQATILGIVGAGGIGYELIVSLKLYQLKKTSCIIIIILFIVVFVDRTSAYIRKKYWSTMSKSRN